MKVFRIYLWLFVLTVLSYKGSVLGEGDEPAADAGAETTTVAGEGDGTDTSTVAGDGTTAAAGDTSAPAAGVDGTTVEGDAPTTAAAATDAETTTGAAAETDVTTVSTGTTVAGSTGATSPPTDGTTAKPETVSPATGGTDGTTTAAPSVVDSKFVPDEEMTDQQRQNSLTLELDLSQANIDWNNEKEVAEFYAWLQETIATLLNQAESRQKREVEAVASNTYKADNVKFAGKHQIKDGKMVLSVFVKTPGSTDAKPPAIPIEKLKAIEAKLADRLISEKNVKPTKIYAGVPAPETAAVSGPGSNSGDDEESVFDAHLGLFLVLIIVSIICVTSIIVGVILLKCRGRHGSYPTKTVKTMEEGKLKEKKPKKEKMIKPEKAPKEKTPKPRKPRSPKKKSPHGEVESPITDEEIMKDEAPMIEKGNPALNGDYMNNREEGWVVPIDELNNEEKLKPEVEDTKL